MNNVIPATNNLPAPAGNPALLRTELVVLEQGQLEINTFEDQLKAAREERIAATDERFVAARGLLSRLAPRIIRQLFDPEPVWGSPKQSQAEAIALLALNDAIDRQYRRVMDPAFELFDEPNLNELAPDLIARSQQTLAVDDRIEQSRAFAATLAAYFADDVDGPDGGYRPVSETKGTRSAGAERKAIRSRSKFVAEHTDPVESMTSERMGSLAENLYSLIHFDNPDQLDPVETPDHIWDQWRVLPPYEAVTEGEAGGELSIRHGQYGYTLSYLTQTVDDSEAKLGLWANDDTADKQFWMVAALREGTWHYEGSDIQTSLDLLHTDRVWNTIAALPDETEFFTTKIEQELALIAQAMNVHDAAVPALASRS